MPLSSQTAHQMGRRGRGERVDREGEGQGQAGDPSGREGGAATHRAPTDWTGWTEACP